MSASSLLIAGPAGPLDVQFCEGQQARAFIMCHPHPLHGGSMNNKVVTTLCRGFSEQGYATLRFNFRGVGQSAGEFDQGVGELQDLLTLIDWLKTVHHIDSIILGGFSFGAFVALSACQYIQPEHLLLVAPPVDYVEFATLKPPTTWSLIVANQDEIVSTPHILTWANRYHAPCQLLAIENASHFFHGHLHTLKAFVHNHFRALS